MPSLASLLHQVTPVFAWAPKGYREMMAKPRNARFSLLGVRPSMFKVEDFDWDGLWDINERVNRSAKFHPDAPGKDVWGPWTLLNGFRVGDCEDYAVHKLQSAMARGYARGGLRLATCLTETGEAHCVLLVYLSDGDAIILDNRTDGLWRKSRKPSYTWIAEEWPGHDFWWRKLS